jgi:regulator of protease activity HflC (stomatin/prohibitin superfamily)
MKKLLLATSCSLLLSACSKVPAGHVGVKVNLLGGEKGVETEELGVGRYWIGLNQELYLFPTFSQNQVWTKDKTEGSPNDDSMTFQTVEGLSVNTDIGITYSIDPTKVSKVFQKYRKGVDEITSIYLRNMVRDALVTVASSKKIESVYGAGKAELITAVQELVIKQTQTIGINVEKVYWIGELRLPQTVVVSINAKIGATQMAAQRENEVAQAKAEAAKAIATAQGEAESRLTLARAEAEAIKIKGEALAKNQDLVKLNAIEKWDGKLPVYQLSGAMPFIEVPK